MPFAMIINMIGTLDKIKLLQDNENNPEIWTHGKYYGTYFIGNVHYADDIKLNGKVGFWDDEHDCSHYSNFRLYYKGIYIFVITGFEATKLPICVVFNPKEKKAHIRVVNNSYGYCIVFESGIYTGKYSYSSMTIDSTGIYLRNKENLEYVVQYDSKLDFASLNTYLTISEQYASDNPLLAELVCDQGYHVQINLVEIMTKCLELMDDTGFDIMPPSQNKYAIYGVLIALEYLPVVLCNIIRDYL